MNNRRISQTPVAWWNANCTNCLKERRRAEKACRRAPTIANKIAYKRLKAVCRKTFKQAKNRLLDSLCILINCKYWYGEDLGESPEDQR